MATQVGSVVAVGIVQCNEDVQWGTFRNVFLSWVITLPATGYKILNKINLS